MTDLGFPRVSCSPVEMCAVDSNFPRVNCSPVEMCTVDSNCPWSSFPAGKALRGTTGQYKAGFEDRLASVYADRDWVTPLRISPQTCTGLFLRRCFFIGGLINSRFSQ